jgi:diguanylate cyclase (GGDEF)-like protein
VSRWEEPVARAFAAVGLDRIRAKLLVFAVTAAILPALATGWMSYGTNKRALREKIDDGLLTASTQAAREIDLWLKQQLYDLRVFGSSYEVTENLDRFQRSGARPGRLDDYLMSVRGRVPDYAVLQVMTLDGRVVGSSPRGVRPLTLPPDAAADLRQERPIFGAVTSDDSSHTAMMNIAAPIKSIDGRVIGIINGRLGLAGLDQTLRHLLPQGLGRLYLVSAAGLPIPTGKMAEGAPGIDSETVATALPRAARAFQYTGRDGQAMLGVVQRVEPVGGAVVAEVPQADAFAGITRLRNLAVLTVLGLTTGLGLLGYFLGLVVVRPLDRLTKAAERVASGDLSVDLPVYGRGEVGYLTRVFNDMVRRLREGREALDRAEQELRRQNQELEHLSITDGLTGLHNRRHLMTTLTHEAARASRMQRCFAALMLDVDGFKRLNDRYGHLAGDEVLARMAGTIRQAIRGVDYAARYGGEEFVVLLPEADAEEAREAAERIRERVERGVLVGGDQPVTVSIGVAVYPANGDTPESVLARADAALYEAKQQGRNRVAVAVGAAGAP